MVLLMSSKSVFPLLGKRLAIQYADKIAFQITQKRHLGTRKTRTQSERDGGSIAKSDCFRWLLIEQLVLWCQTPAVVFAISDHFHAYAFRYILLSHVWNQHPLDPGS